jgi:hypothetical protein
MSTLLGVACLIFLVLVLFPLLDAADGRAMAPNLRENTHFVMEREMRIMK